MHGLREGAAALEPRARATSYPAGTPITVM